jgi:hypothetical protein
MQNDLPAPAPVCAFAAPMPQDADTPLLLSLGVALCFLALQAWFGLG